ncbi:MAG: MmcQ/YjbR family DNA-binding protein [Ferruginibacter sp.]
MNLDSLIFWNRVSLVASALPGSEAGTSYGTPAFKVNKKLFARLKEDGETLVVYTNERDKWMKANPAAFFITDHYIDHPLMLVNLVLVKKKDLQYLLFASWQLRAPASLLKNLK